jgi:class 3 adenylate cyclase
MEPLIAQHNGLIDKYIGDAILALFPIQANDAVNGAITMLKTLSEYNKKLQNINLPTIKIGIGLNTGPLMLGTIGGQNRMESTVIADAVNLASRIEKLTKIYGSHLLITKHTYLALTNVSQYQIRLIDKVKVKGKSEIVTIYEIFDADTPSVITLKNQTRTDFEQGFLLYHSNQFELARQLFKKVLQINKNDIVAQIYLERSLQKSITD